MCVPYQAVIFLVAVIMVLPRPSLGVKHVNAQVSVQLVPERFRALGFKGINIAGFLGLQGYDAKIRLSIFISGFYAGNIFCSELYRTFISVVLQGIAISTSCVLQGWG